MKIHIKSGDPADKFPVLRVKTADVFQNIRGQNDLSRHVQPDHFNLFPGLSEKIVTDGGGVRVAPVVIFRHRGTVSMASEIPAHGDQFLYLVDQLWPHGKYFRKIRHGAQGYDGNLFFFQSLFQEFHRALLWKISRHFRKETLSHSILTVGVHSVCIRAFQRRLLSNVYGNIHAPHMFQYLPGVPGPHIRRDVAGNRGDPHNIQLRRGQSQHQGKRIVDPRITVDYNFTHKKTS